MYDWKRFWCPRAESFRLGDEGYLSDPESKYGGQLNPDVLPFEQIDGAPCLVLLGEPGIGKSTAIRQEISAARSRIGNSGDTLLALDLGDYGDERRLISDVFESREFTEWAAGNHVLHLFLDSLDECRLLIRNAARVLHAELRKHSDKLDRLRFRIACRTADWPGNLTEKLAELWGDDSPTIFELVPLRRRDVVTAATALGLDAEAFLAEVARVGAQPLAIKPVTLAFLMRTYQQSGALPSKQVELYERGCLLLCEESSEDRRGAGLIGALSAEQRLRVAERIAAATVFGGKSSVYTGIYDGSASCDDLSLGELASGSETVRHTSFSVGVGELQETLGTGLFSGRGDERIGFAHRTYAEFLAASYLMHCSVEPPERMKFIRHADDADGRIVPQLRETAAWLAGMSSDVFNEITAVDPQVLLRSDVASVAAEDRQQLLQRLLDLCEKSELVTWDWGDLSHYYKLAHPAIADQLGPYIRDKSKSTSVRRFAIDIADACKVADLQSDLRDLALDVAEEYLLRYRAAYAAMDVGDAATRLRLKALAFATAADDPEFKLRTAALRRMYPSEITAAEVFSDVRIPTDDAYGTYKLFLYDQLPRQLANADLPIALRWAAGISESEAREDTIAKLVATIARQSWDQLHVADVRAAFVDYVLARMRLHEDIVPESEDVEADEDTRRTLVAQTVPRIDDFDRQGSSLIYMPPGLVRSSDVEWMIDRLQQCDDLRVAEYWARLIATAFDASRTEQLDAVLVACETHDVLRAEFGSLLTPIELDSEEATRLRQWYAQHLEWERESERRQNPPLLDPSPAEQIDARLAECEAGNAEAWFDASRDLQLEPNSDSYDHDLEMDLTALPGWLDADGTLRSRMINAAASYLTACDGNGRDWLGTNSTPYGAMWGYKALLLLRKEAPQAFESLPAEVWAKWSPIVVTFHDYAVPQDNKELHDEIAATCASRAPAAVSEDLRQIFAASDRDDGLFVLPQFVQRHWNSAVEATVLTAAIDRSLRPEVTGCLLDILLEKRNAQAQEFAASLTAEADGLHGQERERAILAAMSLVQRAEDAGWGVVWPALQRDIEFGRMVMERVAYKDMLNPSLAMRLSEADVAALYVWLETQYPQASDPQHAGAHAVSQRDAIGGFRDNLLRVLRDRGTAEAITSLVRVQHACPHLEWLPLAIAEAKLTLLRKTWRPLTPAALLQMTQRPGSRLVRSASQLQDVILESLSALQDLLQGETPSAPDLWDERSTGVFRPKDENHLSDYVKRHLERDLRERGIVSLREVQIRRGEGAGVGERTDIHVTGVVEGAVEGSFDTVRVIIEVKGEWHNELQTAMQSQLVGRYLKDNDCQNGIYLVGWYECEQWDAGDGRRNKCGQATLNGLRTNLDEQAEALSVNWLRIKPIVLNASLR